jgi:anti-anti-sigma regulatory factor
VLKITITETPTERKWIVQGRLVEPWVSELRTTWKRAHGTKDKRTCVIDLNDVTFVDQAGERLLRAMSRKGAQFMARGLYVKHVLEQLKTDGRRGVITLIVCLLAGLQTNVSVPVTRGQVPPARMEMRVKEGSGLRFNLANPEPANREQFESEQSKRSTMPVKLKDATGGVNCMSFSADRTARTEEK